MMGFLLPCTSGARVVHMRTLRPVFVRDAFTRYKIAYMMLVPLILKNLKKGMEANFAALPKGKRAILNALIRVNRALTRGGPRLWLSRRLLGQVHRAFGGELRAFGVRSAFTDPATIQFFLDLGIPVANAYGLTEAGTAGSGDDPPRPRPNTVRKPLQGTEGRIVNPPPAHIVRISVLRHTAIA